MSSEFLNGNGDQTGNPSRCTGTYNVAEKVNLFRVIEIFIKNWSHQEGVFTSKIAKAKKLHKTNKFKEGRGKQKPGFIIWIKFRCLYITRKRTETTSDNY